MKDWTIPDAYLPRFIGWHGDNPYDRMTLPDPLGPGWTVRLDLTQEAAGFQNVVEMERGDGVCWTEFTRDMVPVSGQYLCQLRGSRGEEVCHSTPFVLAVGAGVQATEQWDQTLPSEFIQLEQRMGAIHTTALEAAATAEDAAGKAAEAVRAVGSALEAEVGAKEAAAGAALDRERAEQAAGSAEVLSNQVAEWHSIVLSAAAGAAEALTGAEAARETAKTAAQTSVLCAQETRTLADAVHMTKTDVESLAGTATAAATTAGQSAEQATQEAGKAVQSAEQATQEAGKAVRSAEQATQEAGKAVQSAEQAAQGAAMASASQMEAERCADTAAAQAMRSGQSAQNAGQSAAAALETLTGVQGGLAGKLDASRAGTLVQDLSADGAGILTLTTLAGTQRQVDTGVSGRVLAGEAGNAADIRFSDGDTVQAKLDRGELHGRDGVAVTTAGIFSLRVDDRGHLIASVAEGAGAPPVRIDENGHLIYTI